MSGSANRSVEPVIHGVLKIVWTTDTRASWTFDRSSRKEDLLAPQKPEAFAKVQLEEHGHCDLLGERQR